MPHIRFYRWASVLITLPIVLASIPALAQQAGAIVESVTQVDTGRYRLVGTALAANGSPACALAMASGRCMFTCGPGSLRCEGGTASLPLGKFDLTNLPTEANGTIILQIFVQGAISFTQTINPSQPSGTAKWSAYNNTCCSSPTAVYTSTYEVTVDGATKRSVSNSCTWPATPVTASNSIFRVVRWSTSLEQSPAPLPPMRLLFRMPPKQRQWPFSPWSLISVMAWKPLPRPINRCNANPDPGVLNHPPAALARPGRAGYNPTSSERWQSGRLRRS